MTTGLVQHVDDCSSLKRQGWLVEYVMVGQGIVDTERAKYFTVTSFQAVCPQMDRCFNALEWILGF